MELSQGQIIQKPNKQELSSLFKTRRLNVMHAPVKFHKYIPYSLGVMARTRNGTDVRTYVRAYVRACVRAVRAYVRTGRTGVTLNALPLLFE